MVIITQKNNAIDARNEISAISDKVIGIKRCADIYVGFESYDEYLEFIKAQDEIEALPEVI